MSIQFLGMIGHRLSSETIAPVGPIFDRDYIVRFAQTHEAAGFDRLLVGHWSDQPDGFLVTALAGLSTVRDTQLYVQLAAAGMTLFDLTAARAEKDRAQWQAIIDWVDGPD